jgi:signal transduction histidine kinase
VQFPQPQFNAQGDITGAINTLIDITEQKKKEQQKDDFISIASHEMMTPITTAKGYIQLMELSLGTENDTALLYAGKTKKSVERLHTLITELLDASKLQHGQLNYHISTFAFNEMLYETIESMRQISPSHLIIKTGDYSGLVTGDKERLQQVMNNLLSNAIKYSPNVNEINVNIEFKENMLAISVRDYGMGMSEQHLEKIFERYYRVQEHAGSFHGLGMGLYISYNIIRRHGGKMWAISQPGAGSTFYFTIPVKPVVK